MTASTFEPSYEESLLLFVVAKKFLLTSEQFSPQHDFRKKCKNIMTVIKVCHLPLRTRIITGQLNSPVNTHCTATLN